MRIFASTLLVLVLSLFIGCSFLRSRKELQNVMQVPTLRGEVYFEDFEKGRLLIIVSSKVNGVKDVIGARLLSRPGSYFFVLTPGEYWISAFADENENYSHDPTEPVGHYALASPLTIELGEELEGLDIHISRDDSGVLDPPVDEASLRQDFETRIARARNGEPTVLGRTARFGDVVDLERESFSLDNGKMGLWEPFRFILDVNWGFFQLEDYDETKIPMLFVHGAGGHPGQWKYLIDRLDRSRYQPLLYYYPSALRLETLAYYLNTAVTVWHEDYDFDRLIVVAHSMGGLVSRSFIEQNLESGGDYIDTFITLATPWWGHGPAKYGTENSPLVIPSWHDMVPGSPFLSDLFDSPLPSSIDHHLFFGYKGDFIGGSGDGTMALVSILHPAAQDGAVRLYGFDEDHASILRSSAVSERLNGILNSVTDSR